MLDVASPHRATLERAVERIRRATKSVRFQSETNNRRKMAAGIPRRQDLEQLIDEGLGYGHLPAGTIPAVGPAVEFTNCIVQEKRNIESPDDKRQLVVLLNPERYEEAPPLFDLALSDEVLQIATEYLNEIPLLIRVKLWWTPVNSRMKGSQFYHRDGMTWLRRQAKFLFALNDVDETCGPFTFLPADVSKRVSTALGSLRGQERVTDEVIYRHASPEDAVSVVGSRGTGAAVDSSRCFHYGARARGGERLLLMFHFLRSVDAPDNGSKIRRTAAFHRRFGDDPVRELVVPRFE